MHKKNEFLRKGAQKDRFLYFWFKKVYDNCSNLNELFPIHRKTKFFDVLRLGLGLFEQKKNLDF